jgi:spermidine/putrescine transport system substrate-binding protein
MGNGASSRVVRRLLIVLAYIGALAGYLYAPLVWERFFRSPEVLRVYSFYNTIDHQLYREFERQTGVRVLVKYLDSNAELRAQLEILDGRGYDVVTPSDYLVPVLAEKKLIQPLDRTKLTNMPALDERVLGQSFDPENKYSVPFAWTSYGIGYNKAWFTDLPTPRGWAALFAPDTAWHGAAWANKRQDYQVCLLDNPLDVVFAASMFLFGSVDELAAERLQAIAQLLIDGRPWVAGYIEANLQYYLSGVCPAVMATGALMKRLMLRNDQLAFVLPAEGSLISVENFCITRGATHVDLAHKFIDFMLSASAGAAIFNEYGYIPANKQSHALLDQKFVQNNSFFPPDDVFCRLQYIHYRVPLRDIEQIWLDVKSRHGSRNLPHVADAKVAE